MGKERFEGVDIRVRVKGGGHTSRIYGRFTNLNQNVYYQNDISSPYDFLYECFFHVLCFNLDILDVEKEARH